MSMEDIRWQQRFDNFNKAYLNLNNGVLLTQKRALSKLEEQGLIQTFEFIFELAWKTLKDYPGYNQVEVKYPRDTIKKGFQHEIIDDGDIWMDMLEKRNLLAHTYDEATAHLALDLITTKYFTEIKKLHHWFNNHLNEQ